MPLNPFDLRGPQFLVFFAGFAALLVWLVAHLRRRLESRTSAPHEIPPDPYEIAYLRGGKHHVLQVALLALIDRRLLKVNDQKLKTASPDSVDKVHRPLDRAILTKFQWETKASEVFENGTIVAQAEAVGDRLRDYGLLPDLRLKRARIGYFLAALVLLVLVGGVKASVALSRGHHNLGFLIALCIIAGVVLYKTANTFRTLTGQNAFRRMKQNLSGLHARRYDLAPHGPTNEVTLLAAAYGLAALPPFIASEVKPLKLQETSSSGCGGGCAGSSSCGGGSCGGGCGGGCGGCG